MSNLDFKFPDKRIGKSSTMESTYPLSDGDISYVCRNPKSGILTSLDASGATVEVCFTGLTVTDNNTKVKIYTAVSKGGVFFESLPPDHTIDVGTDIEDQIYLYYDSGKKFNYLRCELEDVQGGSTAAVMINITTE